MNPRAPGVLRDLISAGFVLVAGITLTNPATTRDPAWLWFSFGGLLLMFVPLLIADAVLRQVRHLAAKQLSTSFFEHLLASKQIDQYEFDFMMAVINKARRQ